VLVQMAYACLFVVGSHDEGEDMKFYISKVLKDFRFNQNKMHHVILQQISQVHLKITTFNNVINYELSGPKIWNIL
jgi:hypothetical protein